jgi:hypothetical protein
MPAANDDHRIALLHPGIVDTPISRCHRVGDQAQLFVRMLALSFPEF